MQTDFFGGLMVSIEVIDEVKSTSEFKPIFPEREWMEFRNAVSWLEKIRDREEMWLRSPIELRPCFSPCAFSFLRYGRFIGCGSRCGAGSKNDGKRFLYKNWRHSPVSATVLMISPRFIKSFLR
jgi:hypothetical protein